MKSRLAIIRKRNSQRETMKKYMQNNLIIIKRIAIKEEPKKLQECIMHIKFQKVQEYYKEIIMGFNSKNIYEQLLKSQLIH